MVDDSVDRVEYRRKDGIVRAQIRPDPSTAEYQLLAIVADIEGCQIDGLPSLYDEVAHSVEELFETPPSDRAQMEIAFSYAGYRVTLTRAGEMKLVEVKRSEGN